LIIKKATSLAGIFRRPFIHAIFPLALAAYACANSIAPTGGPRDETPPQLIAEESSPNLQTNFEKQPIVLTFDEWIVMEDLFNQVIVSPPLEKRPEVKIKKRSVIFNFHPDEVLRPDATYTINFGEAVRDLNEKNPAENLRFVFATGERLDSLSMSGTIVDAQTGEPVEGALFMLYDNLADSVVRKERPFYFAKANKEGRFRIENIREGLFKGFALKDANLNYRFDQDSEPIGFPDSLLLINDTLSPEVTIRLFLERRRLRVDDIDDKQFGLAKLAFNHEPIGVEATPIDGPDFIIDRERDTIRLWYAEARDQPWRVELSRDSTFLDTVRIQARAPDNFSRDARLRLAGGRGPRNIALSPVNPAELTFNHPLAAYDTTRILLYEDTARVVITPEVSIDSARARRVLKLRHNWQEGLMYELEVLPGAIADVFGLTNVDTIKANYRIDTRKSFGNIKLSISNLDSLAQYIIQLEDNSGKKVSERIIGGQTSNVYEYKLLPPAEYTLRIISDLNRNGRWDTGNYDAKRQPEPVFLKKLEQLRANWDVEAVVEFPD
jgi:hypothetical protein